MVASCCTSVTSAAAPPMRATNVQDGNPSAGSAAVPRPSFDGPQMVAYEIVATAGASSTPQFFTSAGSGTESGTLSIAFQPV